MHLSRWRTNRQRLGDLAATELFLLADGHRLEADTDALEQLTLAAAASQVGREEIRIWIEQRIRRD